MSRLCPDVSFLKNENLSRIQDARVVGPMDLVVEIFSPSTRDYELNEKRRAYRDGGVPEIWLIDPDQRRAVFDIKRRNDYESQTLETGWFESSALPGFRLNMDWLWADPPPGPSECLRQI